MGFWDELVKTGKALDDISGNSHFRFRCPNCGKVGRYHDWTYQPPASEVAEWYRERWCECECSYCFGVDPDRAWIRLPNGKVQLATKEVEGVYESYAIFYVISHHEDTDIYFRCPCIYKTRNWNSCGRYHKMTRIEFFSAKQHGPFQCEFPMIKSVFSTEELLELQLPNFVDRLETAVLPQSVVHQLEREMERRHNSQLARLGYSAAPRAGGRRIAYRRLTIRTDEVIAEEIVYED
jgi:hypothetical protein